MPKVPLGWPSSPQTSPRTSFDAPGFRTIVPHEAHPPERERPGLVQDNANDAGQLFHSRTLRLVASSDARWGELFDTADVMSEGAPRGEGSERSYFGSSNIILLIAPGRTRPNRRRAWPGAVARDPHVRLRAMRVARREAAQRASAPLESGARGDHRVALQRPASPSTSKSRRWCLPDRRAMTRDEELRVDDPPRPALPATHDRRRASAADVLPVEQSAARPPRRNGAPPGAPL